MFFPPEGGGPNISEAILCQDCQDINEPKTPSLNFWRGDVLKRLEVASHEPPAKAANIFCTRNGPREIDNLTKSI